MIDIAPVASMVVGVGSSVGAVGAATLGIKSLIQLSRKLREEMGMGVGQSMRESRRIHLINYENDRRNALSPEQRQAEDDAKLAAADTPENRQSMKDLESQMFAPMTAAEMESAAWERHEELKNQGFVNTLPASTGHEFFAADTQESPEMTAAEMESAAWERHEELKNQGFVNTLPASTGHKFF